MKLCDPTHPLNTSLINGGELDLSAECDNYTKYMAYFISMLCLKHNFWIVDKRHNDLNNGFGKPDKEFGDIAIFRLHTNIPIYTLEEFIENNYKSNYEAR